jgi:hypothetical protein
MTSDFVTSQKIAGGCTMEDSREERREAKGTMYIP